MKTGVITSSRKQANFISRMGTGEMEDHMKRFIAACNPELLIPFIRITNHDNDFRKVEYVIDLPNLEDTHKGRG